MNYDIEYFEKMLRQYSKTAEIISKIRWNFVSQVSPKIVLDYGSGIGWFRAFRPNGILVDSFDVANYPQTGIMASGQYDLVCMWDVLEHIPNFEIIQEVLGRSNYVAISIPIKPDGIRLEAWKHFKPMEHLHYFTKESLTALFQRYDFRLLAVDTPECPPREDIVSFIFKKEDIE